MEPLLKFVPRAAIFLAGAAAGAVALARREGTRVDPAELSRVRRTLSDLEERIAAQAATQDSRLQQIKSRLDEHTTRLDEHAAKLAEVPSTAQIVTAMEQLLQRTMSSLDDRLSTQASSIEVLKTTVAQTDSLLERVLESLDSLQSYSDPTDHESVGLRRS